MAMKEWKLLTAASTVCIFYLFSPCLAENITPTLGDNSAYTISKSNILDYTFSTVENGSTVYYKINIKTDLTNNNPNLTWAEVSEAGENTVSVNVPYNGGVTTKYYKYTYTNVDDSAYVNNSKTEGSFVEGGAIYNSGATEAITADFVGNSIKLTNNTARAEGGAIANEGTVNEINGNFAGNYTESNGIENGVAYGGAIVNNNTVGNITGNFIGNYANKLDTNRFYTEGGAIRNQKRIDKIKGDFIGNYVKSNSETDNASGGAIFNSAYDDTSIGEIEGDFIGNYAESDHEATGGAIENNKTIDKITGNFIGNYAKSDRYVEGGAIANSNTIGEINGNFIENYVEGGDDTWGAQGGAIHNVVPISRSYIIENIRGDFIGNHVNAEYSGSGGAIYNNVPWSEITQDSWGIRNITGNFTGNYVESKNKNAAGGAMFGSAQNITGDFTGNYVQAKNGNVYGGALDIFHSDNITGNFRGNYAETETGNAQGGGIYLGYISNPTINNTNGDFTGNYAKSKSGNAQGGAIYKEGTMGNIKSNFEGNYVSSETGSAQGGAVYYAGRNETEQQIEGNFKNNYAYSEKGYAQGGAVHNTITINKLSGNFEGNYAKTEGGAIWNRGTINVVADENDITFKNNYTGGNFTINEDGSFTVADGVANDIYNEGTVNLNASANRKIELNGSITDSTTPKGTLNIGSATESDGYTGDVYLKDNVTQNNLNLNSGTLHLGEKVNFNNTVSLSLNGGNLNLVNNRINTYNANSLNVGGNVNVMADVDLYNQTMDKITASNVTVADNSHLNITKLNLLSDSKEKTTNINFTENESLKKAVQYTGDKELQGLAPIYKYGVSYDDNTGDFTFQRSGNDYKNINPAIDVTAVGMQGVYTNQTTTFNKALESVDAFMAMPKKERNAFKMQNKYASAKQGDFTINPNISQYEKGEIYVNPYTTFEKIPLKNGPKVSNISYGTLVGGDGKFLDLSNGFSARMGGFLTYNGSHQTFEGNSIYQNGGTLGLTGSLYKGNFFTGLAVNAGASQAKASTMYGNEDFTIFMTGIASKTGYNFEFADGKFIIQPNYLMSYSYIDAFNYRNAAGVKIQPKPLHAIHIEPGVNFIGNLKNGWQPYAGVSMVFNVIDKTNVIADGNKLPETSIKPYVRYGLGLRKNWDERFSCFGQAFVTNGGRNGVTLQAGLTAAVGK